MTRGRFSWRIALVAWPLAIYAVPGIVVGTALYDAIPAVSVSGAIYAGVTWPAWIRGSSVVLPIPAWAFDFDHPHFRGKRA